MTYFFGSPDARLNPGAGISASINWEAAVGTFLSNASRDETNTEGNVVGETLEVNMTTVASGAEVPSYNCTSLFQFAGQQDSYVIHATNSLTWTCVSAPVTTWCT